MDREEVKTYVNQYCKLRDIQYAAYELHARKYNLTSKELFVLDIIWFAGDGCLQSEICERLSATKQTVSAIIKNLQKQRMTAEIKSSVLQTQAGNMQRTLSRLPPAPKLTQWLNWKKKILSKWYALLHCFLIA